LFPENLLALYGQDVNKMLIQSAQSMSFGGTTSQEKTVVLKATKPYTGLRVSFEHVTTSTGALVDPDSAGTILDLITKFTIDVPEYGSRSRRIDLDTHTIMALPMMCQLANLGAADAASATSADPITGADVVPGYNYFDIPINKLNLNEDTRVTIQAAADNAAETLNVHFAFLDTPFRSVYFRAYNVSSGSSNHQQWFPSDGTLMGVVVGGTDGTPVGDAIFNARSSTAITQISLDGEQETTFSNTDLLSAGIDEIISGGGVYDEGFVSKDVYALLRNFPSKPGARYVEVTRASTGLLIVGVMSDA
jgi:hypothetical protein